MLLESSGTYYFFLTYENQPAELWQSDGSPEGNQRLAVIPGDLGATPGPLAFANSRLLFPMDDGVRGMELWAINFDSRFFFLPFILSELRK